MRQIGLLSAGATAAAGLLAALLAVGPAAAANANPSAGKTVAYFQNGGTNPFSTRMKDAFVQEATKYGMKVTVFATPFDPALQAQQIDDAVARGFNLLTVMPANDETVIPPLIRAKAAHIPVIIVNTEMKDGTEKLYTSFVGESSEEMGKLAGEAMVKALEKAGRKSANIVLLTGPLTEGVVVRRVAAIKKALASHPQYKIVAVQDVQWDLAKAEAAAGQLYARFASQGGVDLIYGMADNIAIGAIQAAESIGLKFGTKKGELIVMGGACQPAGIKMLKEGKEYATGIQIPQRNGKAAADLANAYFHGKKLKKTYYQKVDTVTLANLGEWEAACSWK